MTPGATSIGTDGEVKWTGSESKQQAMVNEAEAEVEEAVAGEETTPNENPPKSNWLHQYVATFIVNIATINYGCSVGWAATALPHLQSKDSTLEGGALSDSDASWLVAILCLAAFISTPFFVFLTTYVPRKVMGYVVAGAGFSSWLLIDFTASLLPLYIARALAGVAAGGMLILVPLYVSEIAHDDIRGTLGCFFLFFVNAGILFSYVIGSCVAYTTSSLIYLFLPVLFTLGMIYLPETPYFLFSKAKVIEATASLQWLRGSEADISEDLNAINMSLKGPQLNDHKPSLMTLFSSRGNQRALLISVVLCVTQQLSGIFAILNYTVNIFEESGSSVSPNAATIIVGALQLFGTYLSCILVDRLGRKILLLSSNIAASISLALLGLYLYLKRLEFSIGAFTWLPLACLSTYIVLFSIGIGPVTFVVMTEIFSPQIRGQALSVGYSMIWLLAFLVSKYFTSLVVATGQSGCFWIFATFTALGALFVLFFVPETKGKSVEVILHELNGGQTEIKRKRSVIV